MEITHNNYTELKLAGLKRAEIANKFGIPDWKLKKIISKSGWGKETPIIHNTEVFKTYTEESCYWAGFIAADGNVDCKGRIRIMLKYDDISHLEKFKEYLGSTHKISSNTTTYNRCSFEFTNKNMCEDLLYNFNIISNKSLTIKFPILPEEFLKDFLRGYFDGNGSIYESFSNTNSITASLGSSFVSGSYEFIEYIFIKLKNLLGLTGHLQDFNTDKKWQLKYSTNDSKVLLNYLYLNSNYYLDRKFALYEKIVLKDIRLKR